MTDRIKELIELLKVCENERVLNDIEKMLKAGQTSLEAARKKRKEVGDKRNKDVKDNITTLLQAKISTKDIVKIITGRYGVSASFVFKRLAETRDTKIGK